MRVLMYEVPGNPHLSMAFEEAMWRELQRGKVPNTLRIWRHRSVAIVGYFQMAEEELNFEKIREHKIDVLRRITGGGAVYQDLGCLVWTIAVKGPKGGGINYIYDFLLKGFVNTLKKFATVRVENINDVVVEHNGVGRKVSGTSATFRDEYYLLHGTLLVDTDLQMLSSVLKVPRIKLADKGISEVKYRVTNLNDALGRRVNFDEIIDEMVKSYSELLGERPIYDIPTKDELDLADELYRIKFSTPEWNLLRFPSSYFEKFRNLEKFK
ncbi:MAG: lipoate--protein ligase family protein [Thermoplasmata archaeon]|nr:lipoate--protein ligase family protein [Thermoplasmatales archaeon]